MTDENTVRGLLAAQFPTWADLPLRPLDGGSDHAMFELGDDLLVRLPRRDDSVGQVEKEHRWLPLLGPRLPAPLPVLVGRGAPGVGFGRPWSVLSYLPGTALDADSVTVPRFARELATFVRALSDLPDDGWGAEVPTPGSHNGWRGAALVRRDGEVQDALRDLADDDLDLDAARGIWADALAAPPHVGRPRWIHGDLLPGNLLVDADGGLAAVLDLGCLGVGDPACDLMAAWTVLDAADRPGFRAVTGVDDAAWRRARGWALSFGLIALPYHRTRTPTLAAVAERTIREVTSERGLPPSDPSISTDSPLPRGPDDGTAGRPR